MRLTNDIRRIPLFRDLLGKVTPFALRKMLPQYLLIQNNQIKACTKTFTTTVGLPCAHKMEARGLGSDQVLKLEDIHVHWHIRLANESEDLDDLLRVNEPTTVRPPGRPLGARNKRRRNQPDNKDTRRDPSGFEYSRALFEQAVANLEGRTTQEPHIEPSGGPSDHPIDPPIDPALAGHITANGVAQQEEEALANAFFGPPPAQQRGRGRGGRARGGGRGGGRTRGGGRGGGRGTPTATAEGSTNTMATRSGRGRGIS